MFFSKSTMHETFLHWLITLCIIFLLKVSLSKNNIYFTLHRQKSLPKTKPQNVLSKRRFISLQKGKNCYPPQNLKLPYPNEYLCYCTLEHEIPPNPRRAGPPSGGPRLRARYTYICNSLENIPTRLFLKIAFFGYFSRF